MKHILFVASLAAALSASAAIRPFAKGERVLVLGDSITHGGRYVAVSQFLWDLRHPGSGVSFHSAGICGDTAPGGLARLEWDVFPRKPDRVMVMFGMNDVFGCSWASENPTPQEAAARAAVVGRYETNVTAIVERLLAKGVKVDLITPTPYDEYASFQKQTPSKGVDARGLAALAASCRALAERKGLGLVEFHSVFSPMLQRFPEERFLADRVHPAAAGHLLMAARIVEETGEPPAAMRVALAADGAVAESKSASARDVVASSSCVAFTYAPRKLPVPNLGEYAADRRVYPLAQRLNREELAVAGLAPGAWAVKCEGRTLGVFSAEEFAAGVNLAELDTPERRKAHAAAPLVEELRKTQSRVRTVYAMRPKIEKNGGDFANPASAFAALDRWFEAFKKKTTEHYIKYYGGEIACFKRDYPQLDALNRHEEEVRKQLAEATKPVAPYRLAVVRLRPADVPALFGTNGADRAAWDAKRRGEILDFFTHQVYGARPAAAEKPAVLRFERRAAEEPVFDGLGVACKMRFVYGNGKGAEFAVPFTAYLPAKRKAPAPAFLLIAPHDPDAIYKRVNGLRPHRMDVPLLLSRGYAAVSYDNLAVAADCKDGEAMTNGVWAAFGPCGQKARAGDSWGAISAWAWGASRVMDWIAQEPRLNARRVAVAGLSRCGKTALWAGATDARFACAISCCSGCTGAKLNHVDLPQSESIARINRVFPHWFAPNYRAWGGKDQEMPFDNHQLVALLAPRLCYVASATDDAWAGQPGEWLSASLASPAWLITGRKGLDAAAYPAPETPQHGGSVGYHRRIGPHDQTSYDWARYLDFLDARGWQK